MFSPEEDPPVLPEDQEHTGDDQSPEDGYQEDAQLSGWMKGISAGSE